MDIEGVINCLRSKLFRPWRPQSLRSRPLRNTKDHTRGGWIMKRMVVDCDGGEALWWNAWPTTAAADPLRLIIIKLRNIMVSVGSNWINFGKGGLSLGNVFCQHECMQMERTSYLTRWHLLRCGADEFLMDSNYQKEFQLNLPIRLNTDMDPWERASLGKHQKIDSKLNSQRELKAPEEIQEISTRRRHCYVNFNFISPRFIWFPPRTFHVHRCILKLELHRSDQRPVAAEYYSNQRHKSMITIHQWGFSESIRNAPKFTSSSTKCKNANGSPLELRFEIPIRNCNV